MIEEGGECDAYHAAGMGDENPLPRLRRGFGGDNPFKFPHLKSSTNIER